MKKLSRSEKMNRRFAAGILRGRMAWLVCLCVLLTVSLSVLTINSTAIAQEQYTQYESATPKLTLNRTIAFTFDDVDRYPVITAISFAPNQQIITGGDDHFLTVWNGETGEQVKRWQAHEDWIRGISLAPAIEGSASNGQFASVGQDGTVKVWSLSDFSLVKTFSEKVIGAQNLVYSPSGKVIAVCGFKAEIVLFDAVSGDVLKRWKTPETSINAIRFSPDGMMLAAGGREGDVRVWNTQTGQVLFNLKHDCRRVHALAFSPNGSSLAVGGDCNTISVWDTKTGSLKKNWPIGLGKTFSLVFCDENNLVSGDSFNLLRVWDVNSGQEVAHAIGHTGTIAVLIYDTAKKEILSGSFDTTLRCWAFPPVENAL